MVKWYYDRCANKMDGYGLPVRFLRLVATRYTFGETSGTSHVNPYFNSMNFDEDDLNMLKTEFRAGGTMGEASTIQTVYHESTHAFLDLKDNEVKFKEFIRRGTDYYRQAPLVGGGTGTDPDRIFQEAAASYVGHRVATWYEALELIQSLRETVDEKTWSNQGSPGFYGRAEKMAREIPADYDSRMSDRIFGYEEQGGGLFSSSIQVETTRPISAAIKAFCDDEILEGKISDTFARAAGLKSRHDALLAQIAQSRNLVVVDIAP